MFAGAYGPKMSYPPCESFSMDALRKHHADTAAGSPSSGASAVALKRGFQGGPSARSGGKIFDQSARSHRPGSNNVVPPCESFLMEALGTHHAEAATGAPRSGASDLVWKRGLHLVPALNVGFQETGVQEASVQEAGVQEA